MGSHVEIGKKKLKKNVPSSSKTKGMLPLESVSKTKKMSSEASQNGTKSLSPNDAEFSVLPSSSAESSILSSTASPDASQSAVISTKKFNSLSFKIPKANEINTFEEKVDNLESISENFSDLEKMEETSSSKVDINDENTSTTVDQESEKLDGAVDKHEKMRQLAKLLSKTLFNDNKQDLAEEKPFDNSSEISKKVKKGKKFEGTRVSYLVKKKKFKSNKETEEAMKKDNQEQDQYVLSKLFKHSGVHTALSHDVIVGSENSDKLLLESEAEKVAQEALKIVRRSRSQCFRPSLTSAEPSGKPKKKKFGGESLSNGLSVLGERNGTTNGAVETPDAGQSGIMSSSQLLMRMKTRTERADESEEECEAPSDPEVSANVDLLSDIRNFIAFQARIDGRATTQEIIDRFNERLPSGKSHIFRALLKKICDFRKDSHGEGWWHIKQEFR